MVIARIFLGGLALGAERISPLFSKVFCPHVAPRLADDPRPGVIFLSMRSLLLRRRHSLRQPGVRPFSPLSFEDIVSFGFRRHQMSSPPLFSAMLEGAVA